MALARISSGAIILQQGAIRLAAAGGRGIQIGSQIIPLTNGLNFGLLYNTSMHMTANGNGEGSGDGGGSGSGSGENYGSPRNAADYEKYKDLLRSQMSRPYVKDTALKVILDKIYRAGAQIGSGSSAAALRYENATGQAVGGRKHAQKVGEMITALKDWIKRNACADSNDRAAAENVLKDLENALMGK